MSRPIDVLGVILGRHPERLAIRCGARGCGAKLASVYTTPEGPVLVVSVERAPSAIDRDELRRPRDEWPWADAGYQSTIPDPDGRIKAPHSDRWSLLQDETGMIELRCRRHGSQQVSADEVRRRYDAGRKGIAAEYTAS